MDSELARICSILVDIAGLAWRAAGSKPVPPAALLLARKSLRRA